MIILRTIWHIWCLLFILANTLVCSFLVLVAIPIPMPKSVKHWLLFLVIGKFWGKLNMLMMGIFSKIEWVYKPSRKKQYILIGNHVSFLDVFCLFSRMPFPFTFMGKKELGKLPLFGLIYKKMCVVVDRGNAKARKEAMDKAKNWVQGGDSICIFPEGGIPKYETDLAPFKAGAFVLAKELGVPLLPVVNKSNGKMFPYKITKGGIGIAKLKVLPPVETEGRSANELKEICFNLMEKEIKEMRYGKS